MKKLLILMLATVLIAGCVGEPYSPYRREFAGVKLNFRADLDEAAKVKVYPNETALRNVILNNNVQEIGVAYIPKDNENAFYLAASYELAYKLTIINRYYFNATKPITSIPVNSSMEALAMATNQMPIIMLVGESKTNSTLVNVVGYFVTVQGASFEEVNRTYNDLDLATDKLLLVMMKQVSI
ncbi:MAG: hypothetical protein V1678_05380 [Candidatus Aenigmatarchaeota archaeon]